MARMFIIAIKCYIYDDKYYNNILSLSVFLP